MNLRDKLNRLDKSASSIEPDHSAAGENPSWIQDFERELAAKVLQEQNSFIILKENYYPLYDLDTLEFLKTHDFQIPNFHHIAPDVESGDFIGPGGFYDARGYPKRYKSKRESSGRGFSITK